MTTGFQQWRRQFIDDHGMEPSAADAWNATQPPQDERGHADARLCVQNWMGEHDVVLRHAAFAALIDILAASAPAQQAPAKLTRYDRDEGGMFPSPSGDWVLYEKLAEQMATPPQPVAAEVMTESVAKAIYQQWKELPGFRPWEERGNSLMQDKARDLARAALSSTGSDESKKGEA